VGGELKKGLIIALMVIVVMAGGLGLWATNGGASSNEKLVMDTHTLNGLMVSKKEFSERDLVLVDSRDGSKIETVKASSINSQEAASNLAEELEAKYDQVMVPVKLGSDGILKGGQSRIVLDTEALLKEIDSVNVFQTDLEVPISETKPNVTKESIANIDQVVLASFTTKFNPSVSGRTRNIELSSEAINKIILGPGDRFYYNTIVGETTVEKGYQKAMEIKDHKLVEGIGGGICQTSSTLYNAIEMADLAIIELHHHSLDVAYVAKDRDATVSFGGKDFKFQNNKNYPIMIKSTVNKQKGTLQVQVTAANQ